MKKIISILLVVVISMTSFSQQINPKVSLTKQHYLQKSKHQINTAWMLLGGGFALSTIGLDVNKVHVSNVLGNASTKYLSTSPTWSNAPEIKTTGNFIVSGRR